MAERTKGGGFRERIHFDAALWHEIEAVAAHLRLKPGDLVQMMTAMGIAQMKALTQMGRTSEAVQTVMKQELEADFQHMTGVSGSEPVVGTAPHPGRPAPARPGGVSAPGRGAGEPREAVARVPGSYLVGRDGRSL